jgi:phosphoribosylamine--glycine ligase
MMQVLVVGSGGREHALVWKIAQSPRVDRLFCAPGNAGIAELATCVDIGAEDIDGLAGFAAEHRIDLTVVGPERPLIAGIVDEFERRSLRIFGPTRAAARLEGSKAFADELRQRHGIPSGAFRVFDDPDAAKRYVESVGAPIVIKADGDAAGKGVTVAHTVAEAIEAVDDCMVRLVHGAAGRRVVVEECLSGQECTIKVFTDGEHIVPMVPSQDHKPIFDGDRGPNTGGMGCYSPVPAVPDALLQEILDRLIEPTVRGMAADGHPYRGVLYGGLMLTDSGPKVLEYNCRFGDPEAQVVLSRLKSDLVEVLLACVEGRLNEVEAEWRPEKCVCIVMASGGYPGAYEKGKPITGIEDALALGEVEVFHAGTSLANGRLVTNGGRVLGVTALGGTFGAAIDKAYAAVSRIRFEGAYFRRDIAGRALGAA